VAWNGSALDTVWISGAPAANANWIGGWHLGPQDREVSGKFTGTASQILVRSRRWAALLAWDSRTSAMSCPWMTGEPGQNLDWIGGWHLSPRDQVAVADVNGDGHDEVFIRSPSWAGLLAGSGSGLTSWLVQQANVGNWNLNPFDNALPLRRPGGTDLFLHHPWGWTAAAQVSGAGPSATIALTSAQFREIVA